MKSMIYCANKISKAKCNKHIEVIVHSLNNDSVDFYEQALEKAQISNHDNRFDNPDIVHSEPNFISRIKSVIAPIGTFRIENNTGECFDGETGEKTTHEINYIQDFN